MLGVGFLGIWVVGWGEERMEIVGAWWLFSLITARMSLRPSSSNRSGNGLPCLRLFLNLLVTGLLQCVADVLNMFVFFNF